MKKLLLVLAIFLLIPVAAKAQTVGYDGGFFIKNDDGSFKIRFTGRLQPKVEYVWKTVPTPDDLANGWNKDRFSFSIRRAELGFQVTVEENLIIGAVFKHSTNSQNFSQVNIGSAVATYVVMPEFTVSVGMVGLPLSMMSEVSSRWFLLPEAPLTELQDDGIANFTIARASFSVPDGLGVNFAGDISKFFYSASVINGNESNYAFNPNRKVSAGLRVGYNILDAVPGSMTDYECSSRPKLTMSIGTDYQARRTDPNTGAQLGYLWTSSMGIGLRWGGFAFTTEGYFRRTKVNNPGTAVFARPHLDDFGYYAAAGYYIIPKKFEIAGQAAQIFRQGPDNNSNQFGGGLNYYAIDNNLKFQLAYTWTQDYDDLWGAGNDNHIHNIALLASAMF